MLRKLLSQMTRPEWGSTRSYTGKSPKNPRMYPEHKRTNLSFYNFPDRVGEAKFRPRHLIDVKIPIDAFLLKQNETMRTWLSETEIQMKNVLYH